MHCETSLCVLVNNRTLLCLLVGIYQIIYPVPELTVSCHPSLTLLIPAINLPVVTPRFSIPGDVVEVAHDPRACAAETCSHSMAGPGPPEFPPALTYK